MIIRVDPVLDAIVEAAVGATAARDGWILSLEHDRVRLLAAAGEQPGLALGVSAALGTGTAGYAIASGQPLAISSGAGDPRLREGIAAALEREIQSVLSLPCATVAGVVGALELVDKKDVGSFSIDDLEIGGMLARIAGAALANPSTEAATVDAPEQLCAELQALAAAAPGRYVTVANVIGALLARE